MANVSAETVRSISTPDKVESRLGTLEFNDGAPSEATAALLYDHLDFIHGVQAFIGAYPGASVVAIRRGFRSIGAEDNTIVSFSELMDSASLFLTANCDTFYFLGFVDLSDGPMVIDVPALEAPSAILGTIDDMWFRWVTDFGLPGPDRARAASTCSWARATTAPARQRLPRGPLPARPGPWSGPGVHGRQRPERPGRRDPQGLSHLEVRARRSGHRDRYVPRRGRALRCRRRRRPRRSFVEASGMSFNTIPPNDFGFWDTVNELIQQEPPSGGDPELLGMLARLGIVHGKPFEPDERMRKVLEDAAVVGNATARTVSFAFRPEEGFAYYPGSNWFNMLWVGGYEFLDPPPQITPDGVVPSPSDGARKLNSKIAFLYPATGVTPAMCMRLTGIGSQYLMAVRGSDGEYLDGGRNYRLTLPPDIPQSRFWSVMVYDRQTRSMLQTDQPRPDLSSQSGTVETNPDGSTDIYFGPTAPDGKANNWLQTVPGKGWWTILRLYSPEASFFDKTWRPTEIEPV